MTWLCWRAPDVPVAEFQNRLVGCRFRRFVQHALA